jgi:hypothetical protein
MQTFKLSDGTSVKLGRVRPRSRPLALRFSDYIDLEGATQPPATIDYTQKALQAVSQMYGNDAYGDCVIASLFHAFGIWSGNESNSPVVGTTTEAVNAYHTICGPGDNGCVITDVYDYAQQHGVTIGGKLYKIDGYVAIDWTNKTEVQYAIWLFGIVKLGVNLPQAWMDSSDVWDVPSGRGATIIGGHDIPIAGYNDQGVKILTWAGTRLITWKAFLSTTWVEEAYISLEPEWYKNANLAPCGVNVSGLQQDMAKIAAGLVPPVLPGQNPVATTLSLLSSANPVQSGQPVVFTATVNTGISPNTPTGNVVFSDGSSTISTNLLNGNHAAFSTNSLSVGDHQISASYSGDTNFTGSVSSTLTQTVMQNITPPSSIVNPGLILIDTNHNMVYVPQDWGSSVDPLTATVDVTTKKVTVPNGWTPKNWS